MVRVGVTVGDPLGIGPEVTVKALAMATRATTDVTYRIFADAKWLTDEARRYAADVNTAQVEWADVPLADGRGAEGWRALSRDNPEDPRRGLAQLGSLRNATDAVLAGTVDGLCTAPITKRVMPAREFPFPGHTEFLAAQARSGEVWMMLAGPRLRVVPLTIHLPLAEVPRALAKIDIAGALVTVAKALAEEFAIAAPRIALTGLNPHAGEGGMFGDEEQRLLVPAIAAAERRLREQRLKATFAGPLPADGLFARQPVPYDVVVCCYHDQALIPVKLVHPHDAVNVTLGLPFVRTSPAHGSALDIAGRGIADPRSMLAALELAAGLIRSRRAL